MISDATPKEVASLKKEKILRTLLFENARYRQYSADRGYWTKLAKGFGLTNQEIADAYGITEAAVRGLIKRAK